MFTFYTSTPVLGANILFRLVSFRRLAHLLGSALLQELFILNTSIILAYTGGSAWIYYMYLFCCCLR